VVGHWRLANGRKKRRNTRGEGGNYAVSAGESSVAVGRAALIPLFFNNNNGLKVCSKISDLKNHVIPNEGEARGGICLWLVMLQQQIPPPAARAFGMTEG
jgi:hypothetical protein